MDLRDHAGFRLFKLQKRIETVRYFRELDTILLSEMEWTDSALNSKLLNGTTSFHHDLSIAQRFELSIKRRF